METIINSLALAQANPVARFMVRNHEVILKDDKSIECKTCSISRMTANAIVFMYENGVLKAVIDGANIERK
jgi:ferredoxin-like protein FixX